MKKLILIGLFFSGCGSPQYKAKDGALFRNKKDLQRYEKIIAETDSIKAETKKIMEKLYK